MFQHKSSLRHFNFKKLGLISLALISSVSAFANPHDGAPIIVVPPGRYWDHRQPPSGPVIVVPPGRIPPQPPRRGANPPPSHRIPPVIRRPIYTPPAMSAEENEQVAADMVSRNMTGLGCERMGEALRRLSNQILSSTQQSRRPALPNPGDERGRLRQEERSRWDRVSRTPAFWLKVWNRVADAYRGCNLDCFEDGVAVGQISASTYCSASIALGGLDSPGFLPQPPLPLCQNSIFAGCQSGYQSGAASVEGCSNYTAGQFDSIFKAYQSQDCHVD